MPSPRTAPTAAPESRGPPVPWAGVVARVDWADEAEGRHSGGGAGRAERDVVTRANPRVAMLVNALAIASSASLRLVLADAAAAASSSPPAPAPPWPREPPPALRPGSPGRAERSAWRDRGRAPRRGR